MPELTLHDIAERASVSKSTVSRVINHDPHVNTNTRARVEEVIRATGFTPNAAARALVSQLSGTIGLVLPHSVSMFFTDPYFPHLVKGVSQACTKLNMIMALFLADSAEDQKNLFARVTRKGLLDGVVVQSGHHGDQTLIHQLVNSRLPTLVAGRPLFEKDASYIDIDNVAAASKAVTHLIACGCKRIATLTGPSESAVGVDRLQGYWQALVQAGLPLDRELVVESDFTELGGYNGAKALLKAKPDGLFAASDLTAIGAIRALREAGLCVPGDVAVVGFDDMPIPQVTDLGLTTIRQPVVQFGVKAAEMLLEMIQNPSHPRLIEILETELVIRKTCGYNLLAGHGGENQPAFSRDLINYR